LTKIYENIIAKKREGGNTYSNNKQEKILEKKKLDIGVFSSIATRFRKRFGNDEKAAKFHEFSSYY